MSRHLRVLRRSGLVEEDRDEQRDARLRVYRLRRKPIAELRVWINHLEEFWSDQLDAFKAHAERPAAKGKGI